MVTGDHLRTAVSVAHQCNILPEGKAVVLIDAGTSSSGSSGSEAVGVVPGGSASVSLSVLYPDGSVMQNAQRGLVMSQVLTGDMECAVTGKGFDCLLASGDESLLQPALRRACVWARMSPDNKAELMQLLGSGLVTLPESVGGVGVAPQPLGLHVGFCGDGANDCGALKSAHVGEHSATWGL
jgi:cation-transporting ATPase 13A2